MKRESVDHAGNPRRRTELETTFARFVALSYADQLDFVVRVQRYLDLPAASGAQLDEHEKQRASLDCLRQAQVHLGLATAPTYKQYIEAARELDLAWSAQQIQRLWGRWLEAANALESGRPPRSAAARSFARTYSGRKRTREDYLTAVRVWLASAPPRERAGDYDDWVREYNRARSEKDPLPRAVTVVTGLALPWGEVLAIARGEQEHPDVVERRKKRDWTRGPHRLVSLSTIALMSGLSQGGATAETKRFPFPLPVATFRGRRAWVLEEVEAYLGGEQVPRLAENRLRHLYIDVHEYAELVGLSVSYAQAIARDVEPAGMVGSTRYWLRHEVEQWAATNKRKVEERKQRIVRTGTAHVEGESDFVSSRALMGRLGINVNGLNKLTGEKGFPEPVARFGNNRVWLLGQVEAYLAEQPLPEPDSALAAKLIDAGALSEMLALKRGTSYPSRTDLPPPLMAAGRSRLWHADEVEAWIAALPASRRGRINRRREKRGMPPL